MVKFQPAPAARQASKFTPRGAGLAMQVYILFSSSLGRHYVGMTKDTTRRLIEHNRGKDHWTSRANDWTLTWSQIVPTRDAARRLERQIKSRGAARFLGDQSAA